MKQRNKNIKNKRHYILLEPGKEPRFFRFNPKEDFNENVHKLLKCDCYEHVTCPFDIHLLVDESGVIKNLPFNESASALYLDPCIYGPALVCSVENADFAPLSQAKIFIVLSFLSQMKKEGQNNDNK